MTLDFRLTTAAILERDADEDDWLLDTITVRCRAKRQEAARLRGQVAAEAEARQLQREADRQLERGPRKARAA